MLAAIMRRAVAGKIAEPRETYAIVADAGLEPCEAGALIGSMNFDYRSLRLNTELGILVESPELARKVAARFDAMAQPDNS